MNETYKVILFLVSTMIGWNLGMIIILVMIKTGVWDRIMKWLEK